MNSIATADMGVPPDPGYRGHDGTAIQGGKPYNLHDVRKFTYAASGRTAAERLPVIVFEGKSAGTKSHSGATVQNGEAVEDPLTAAR